MKRGSIQTVRKIQISNPDSEMRVDSKDNSGAAHALRLRQKYEKLAREMVDLNSGQKRHAGRYNDENFSN